MLARNSLPLLLAATPTAWAETHTVGPNGGGFDHSSIQGAVLAAADGDTIRVAPGTYGRFTLDGKHLDVIGAGSAATFIEIDGPPTLLGSGVGITLRFIGTGTTRIGGFTFLQNEPQQTSERPWIDIDSCDGSIELFDLQLPSSTVNGYNGIASGVGFIDAFRVRQLVMSGCHVRGAADLPAAPALAGSADGYRGLNLRYSRAWAVDCTFEGCAPGLCSDPEADPLRPGHGVFADRARLLLSNCSVRGGQGSPTLPAVPPQAGECAPTVAGDGVRAILSEVELHVGAQTLTAGGFGPADSLGGAGVALSNGLLRYPSVPLSGEPVGGLSENGPPGGCIDLEGPKGIIQAFWPARPTTRALEYLVPLGGDLALEHTGSAGSWVLPFLSLSGGEPAIDFPSGDQAFLDPLQSQALLPVLLDESGSGTSTVAIPAIHELLDATALVQSAEARDGAFYLSSPVTVATTL